MARIFLRIRVTASFSQSLKCVGLAISLGWMTSGEAPTGEAIEFVYHLRVTGLGCLFLLMEDMEDW